MPNTPTHLPTKSKMTTRSEAKAKPTTLKQTFIVDPGPEVEKEIVKNKKDAPLEIRAIKSAKTSAEVRFPPELKETPSKTTHFVGAHIGGVSMDKLPTLAGELGIKSFALFLGSPHSWSPTNHPAEDVEKFKEHLKETDISPHHILPHMPYLVNLGSLTPRLRATSIGRVVSDVKLCGELGLKLYNVHPGSAKGYTNEKEYLKSLENVADSINQIHIKTADVAPDVKVVIENTAGSGNVLGNSFEEIAYIINRVKDKTRVGVCIDTQHTFASGYDLKNDFKGVMKKFADVIGFEFLCSWHVNDSQTVCGSHVDRHACIGKGNLGLDFFKQLIKSPWTQNMPLVTETEASPDKETQLLYNLQEDKECNMQSKGSSKRAKAVSAKAKDEEKEEGESSSVEEIK